MKLTETTRSKEVKLLRAANNRDITVVSSYIMTCVRTGKPTTHHGERFEDQRESVVADDEFLVYRMIKSKIQMKSSSIE